MKNIFLLYALAILLAACNDEVYQAEKPIDQRRAIESSKVLSSNDLSEVQKSPSPNNFNLNATYKNIGEDSGVRVDEVRITQSGVALKVASTSSSEKVLYKSETYCANSINGGIFTLFQDVCTRKGVSEYFTKIKAGGKTASASLSSYQVLGSSPVELFFSGESFVGIGDFSIEGANFSTANFTLPIPEEQKVDLDRVKKYVNENAVNVRKLSLLANRFRESPSAVGYLTSVLRDDLRRLSSISAYSVAVATLGKDVPGTIEITDDFISQVYKDEIRPMNNPELNSQFIDRYKAASGGVLNAAYSDAVSFKKEEIKVLVNREAFSGIVGKIKKIFDYYGDSRERVGKKVYSEAIRAKDSGNLTLYAVIIKSIMTSDDLLGTDTLFKLETDKEMRDFLGEQFGKLISSNREASREVGDAIQSLGISISKQMASVNESLNRPIDLEAERQATQRFLIQSHNFDLAYKRI